MPVRTCDAVDDYGRCHRQVRVTVDHASLTLCPAHKPIKLERTHRGPRYGERARLQVLVPVDLFNWVHAAAKEAGISTNRYVSYLLTEVRKLQHVEEAA